MGFGIDWICRGSRGWKSSTKDDACHLVHSSYVERYCELPFVFASVANQEKIHRHLEQQEEHPPHRKGCAFYCYCKVLSTVVLYAKWVNCGILAMKSRRETRETIGAASFLGGFLDMHKVSCGNASLDPRIRSCATEPQRYFNSSETGFYFYIHTIDKPTSAVK